MERSKRLFFSALCGTNAAVPKTAAFIRIRSAAVRHLVGYQNKETREELNYIAPTFLQISGGNQIKLQDLQMDEDAANYSAEIHVLSANQQVTETYTWFKKRTDGTAGPKSGNRWPVPEGKNGLWFLYEEIEDEAVYTYNTDAVKNKTFAAGSGIELNSGSDERTVSFMAPYELNPAK